MTERFDIEIDIVGPVSTAGLVTTTYGVDTSFLRDHKERMVIPRTLVKGVVRHILEAMSARAPTLLPRPDVEEWLGSGSGDVRETATGRFEPARERIRFTDFVFQDKTGKGRAAAHTLTRIEIDDDTGSVAHGMLQVIESPLAIGETGTVRGSVSIDLESAQAKEAKSWVLKALRLAPALGGVKGAGFGRIECVREQTFVQPAAFKLQIPTDPAALSATDAVRYVLMLDEPFLVGSEAISGNLFRGSIIIPGAAVKGALADRLDRDNKLATLATALDKVVFRHARPVKAANGAIAAPPSVIPRSLYSVEEITSSGDVEFKGLADAIATPVDDLSMLGKIITFQGDWKPDSTALSTASANTRQTFEPVYDVRTRTAVGEDDVAETGKLFTRLAVCPDAEHVWAGELLCGDASAAEFNAVLNALSEGLDSLGKTRATARVAILKRQLRTTASLRSENGKTVWRIVLETDALLHGPGDFETHATCIDRAERLSHQYRDYFAGALGAAPNAIELRFFAQQRWVGGYQAVRFSHFPDRYAPQLLTLAGSVFELKVPPAFDEAVASLASIGLPLPASVPPQKFEYQRSPFNPENGYGEVSIEARDLSKPAPKET